MRRRFRWRRVLKWCGTIACGLILLAACANLRWGIAVSGRYWQAAIDAGSCFLWVHPMPLYKPGVRLTEYGSTRKMIADWYTWGIWPDAGPSSRFVAVPLWVPFVLIGIPTAILWRLDRRRAPGCCVNCGYDLTGNVSGRCPECGEAV